MTTLLDETRPRARTAHGCGACLGTITPGSTYVRQRLVDGGDAWVWKAHELCNAVFAQLHRELELLDDEVPDLHELRVRVADVLMSAVRLSL